MLHLHNVLLHLAYDGTHYFGWQKTSRGPSIEETLEKVLTQIFQHTIHLQAASRTDRGVHADEQVVNFFTTKPIKDFHRLHISLNQLLPQDIRVLKVDRAPTDTFHPTLDAKGKEYHYHIANTEILQPSLRLYHWHVPQKLNIDNMIHAAELLEGTHDFTSLKNRRKQQKKGSIRTLSKIVIQKHNDRITIKIVGNNFLYKMARNIVGTLVYIGLGKIPLENISHILDKRHRSFAGITAPAQGLTLHKVFY